MFDKRRLQSGVIVSWQYIVVRRSSSITQMWLRRMAIESFSGLIDRKIDRYSEKNEPRDNDLEVRLQIGLIVMVTVGMHWHWNWWVIFVMSCPFVYPSCKLQSPIRSVAARYADVCYRRRWLKIGLYESYKLVRRINSNFAAKFTESIANHQLSHSHRVNQLIDR